MASLEEIREERLKKLQVLKDHGIDPYPSTANITISLTDAVLHFESLKDSKKEETIGGRIKALRVHGGSVFVDLFDGTNLFQAFLKKDVLCDKEFDLFLETIDIGDFIEVTGTFFLTKREEKSLEVKSWRILVKSLQSLPEKWHGLQDKETRFRKRYLDLIMSEEVRNKFLIRTKVVSAFRKFLDERNFQEVETPTLQPIYGGGFAKPFVTHHNSLDADFYLRISDELYLKRLLVGGYEKVYEITKVFRNEGIDFDHNPEFTMFEAQIAYKDYVYGMDLTEEIVEYAAIEATGKTEFKVGEDDISVKRPWKRMTMVEAIKETTGIDPMSWNSVEDARASIKQMDIDATKLEEIDMLKTIGELIAFSFEETVEEKLIQPTIIYDYPVEVSPLAKRCGDERFAQRFEWFAFGSELGNNYSELNDPQELQKRFIEEKNKEEAGFAEAHQHDADYVEAIEHGMPPACGLGIGIDRLCMLLLSTKNVKETILFPTLRPKE